MKKYANYYKNQILVSTTKNSSTCFSMLTNLPEKKKITQEHREEPTELTKAGLIIKKRMKISRYVWKSY